MPIGIEDILISKFAYSMFKKSKLIGGITLLIIGSYIIYKQLSFSAYLKSNMTPDFKEISYVLTNGSMEKYRAKDNRGSLRRYIGVSIHQLFLWAVKYDRNNMKFTTLIFAPAPTNALRMTKELIEAALLQTGERNFSQEQWRTEKVILANKILSKKENSIYTIYTNDDFMKDKEGKKLFKESLKKYDNIKAFKVKKLPPRTYTAYIYEVKEFFHTNYYLFSVIGKQDEGKKKPVVDETVEVYYEVVSDLKMIQTPEIRYAVDFWLKNRNLDNLSPENKTIEK